MKKIMKTLKAKAISAQATIVSKSGEGYVDTIAKILISVVLGALILGALYSLYGNNILPQVTTKVGNMFNYTGH